MPMNMLYAFETGLASCAVHGADHYIAHCILLVLFLSCFRQSDGYRYLNLMDLGYINNLKKNIIYLQLFFATC